MKEISSCTRNFLLKRYILCFQSKRSPGALMGLKRIYTLLPFIQIRSIKNFPSHFHKLLYPFSASLILIPKMIIKKLFYVAGTELNGDIWKAPFNRSPKGKISINYKVLQWIKDSVSKGNKDRLQGLFVLTHCKPIHGDILSLGICRKKQSVFLSPDKDSLSICQKVTSPLGFKFLGHLFNAFRVSPKLIDLTEGCQRSNPKFFSYSSIRGFFSKIKIDCLRMHIFIKLQILIKRLFTLEALVLWILSD